MGLDEVHLEDEGFLVAMDQNEIEMVHVHDHGRDFALLRAKEILADPLLEGFGFSDIDDLIVFVLHQIDARSVGEQSDEALDGWGKHGYLR